MNREFELLASVLEQSGCVKKQIAAGTYSFGRWVTAVNSCEYKGDSCPRIGLPSGSGYDLCQAIHAEASLAHNISQSDGIAWVLGHYYACEPCASLLKSVGVKEIRIRERIA